MARASYVPHIEKERIEMLEAIGVSDINQLFSDIPQKLQVDNINIPNGKSEIEVERQIKALANSNRSDLICFLGGGFYDHYCPAAVDAILTRGEFYTSYTPNQPEVSQ